MLGILLSSAVRWKFHDALRDAIFHGNIVPVHHPVTIELCAQLLVALHNISITWSVALQWCRFAKFHILSQHVRRSNCHQCAPARSWSTPKQYGFLNLADQQYQYIVRHTFICVHTWTSLRNHQLEWGIKYPRFRKQLFYFLASWDSVSGCRRASC